uniref:Uncharacterized protein LOC108950802 n=1 Tax=Phallusia mammillata TaxID=59560 RepID=A0A6F9DK36_9ASCI|nr:uncharacterized protein LOC108950802 [Phallusia mammillata]
MNHICEEQRFNLEAEQKRRDDEAEQRKLHAEFEQRNLEAENEKLQQIREIVHELHIHNLELESGCRCEGKTNRMAPVLLDEQDDHPWQGRSENEVKTCDKVHTASATQTAKQNVTTQDVDDESNTEFTQKLIKVQLHTMDGSKTSSSNQKSSEQNAATQTVADTQYKELFQDPPYIKGQLVDTRSSISALQQIVEQPTEDNLAFADTSESIVYSAFFRVLSSITTRRHMQQPMLSGFAESYFRDSKPNHLRENFHTFFRSRRKQGKGKRGKHRIRKETSSVNKSFEFPVALINCRHICVSLCDSFLRENLFLKTRLCHKCSTPSRDNITPPLYYGFRTPHLLLQTLSFCKRHCVPILSLRTFTGCKSPLFYLEETATAS